MPLSLRTITIDSSSSRMSTALTDKLSSERLSSERHRGDRHSGDRHSVCPPCQPDGDFLVATAGYTYRRGLRSRLRCTSGFVRSHCPPRSHVCLTALSLSPSLPLSRRSCCRHIEQCCRHTDTVDTLIAAVGVRLSTHCCVVPFFYHIVLSSLSITQVLSSQCCPLSAALSVLASLSLVITQHSPRLLDR